jgi:hypothetical protein
MYTNRYKKMGSLERYKNRFSSSKKNLKVKSLKSKGERLGWVSISDVETVDLKRVLTNGEVVRLSQDNRPMLVP